MFIDKRTRDIPLRLAAQIPHNSGSNECHSKMRIISLNDRKRSAGKQTMVNCQASTYRGKMPKYHIRKHLCQQQL